MTLIDAVAQRIDGSVAQLAGRIEYIAELAALVNSGAQPQRDSGAFVIPLGIDAAKPTAATGMFLQNFTDSVGVVLYVKAQGDVKARKALPAIDALKDAVIVAIAGWSPGNTIGVFSLLRGRLLSADSGLVLYQLDFTIADQLRIAA